MSVYLLCIYAKRTLVDLPFVCYSKRPTTIFFKCITLFHGINVCIYARTRVMHVSYTMIVLLLFFTNACDSMIPCNIYCYCYCCRHYVFTVHNFRNLCKHVFVFVFDQLACHLWLCWVCCVCACRKTCLFEWYVIFVHL